jgi:hypothetical protein
MLISGKDFSTLCKWVYDPRYPDRTSFSYALVQDGDWVFLNGDYIAQFLASIPILATKRFTLIIHNSDLPFTEEKFMRLRQHIYHIYAINTTFRHPRLTTIPLGFADNQLDFLSSFRPESANRDIEVYLNIKVHHNREKREDCINAFQGDPRVVHRERVSVPDYYADLCRSKFVLCPEGTGIDTHRVYESILCGATPVVLRNSLTHLYERLPVCIVDRWTDPFTVPPPQSVSFDPVSFLTQRV